MQDQSNQVSRDDDQQTHKVELLAAVVLHVLVSIAPDALTVIQVSAECERDPDTSDDREEVEAALNVLVTDGLACKQDDGFTATHPAVRANELSFWASQSLFPLENAPGKRPSQVRVKLTGLSNSATKLTPVGVEVADFLGIWVRNLPHKRYCTLMACWPHDKRAPCVTLTCMTTCNSRKTKYLRGSNHHNYKHDRWTTVDAGYATPCWIWRLSRNDGGYGVEWDGKAMRLAHRVAYERENGVIPAGLTLDHLCRERSCVRPDHLEVVTQAENVRPGRRAKLTLQQVDEIRKAAASQKVLARRYGISPSQVSRIKRGKSWNTTRMLLAAIARDKAPSRSPKPGRLTQHARLRNERSPIRA